MGVVEIGKDELKDAGKMYHTDPRTTHPRSLVDWVNASDDQFGATISSSVIAFDYIDPTDKTSEGTLIQPILFASRKSCHKEGNEYCNMEIIIFHFRFIPNLRGGKCFRQGKQAEAILMWLLIRERLKMGYFPKTIVFSVQREIVQ